MKNKADFPEQIPEEPTYLAPDDWAKYCRGEFLDQRLHTRSQEPVSVLAEVTRQGELFDRTLKYLELAPYCTSPDEANEIFTELNAVGMKIPDVSIDHNPQSLLMPRKPFHPYNLLRGQAISEKVTGVILVTCAISELGFTKKQEREIIRVYNKHCSIYDLQAWALARDVKKTARNNEKNLEHMKTIRWLTSNDKIPRYKLFPERTKEILSQSGNSWLFYARHFSWSAQRESPYYE